MRQATEAAQIAPRRQGFTARAGDRQRTYPDANRAADPALNDARAITAALRREG